MDTTGFQDTLAVLAGALGSGLLMGIERERRKGQGPLRALAGVRSFTLAAVSGATAALLGSEALVAVGAVFIALLGVVAYARDRSEDPGVTTEIALLLAYLIGVLCTQSLPVAAGLAVAVTSLLAAREALHEFSREWLRQGEVRGGLILAALALLVLPLAPNQPLWGEALNPQVLVRLVVVLLVIQALAHLARRLMDARRANALSALASGFISSTATIA
ncbi:MAG: MgtC/SapB family protein, partial [Diaphorobacter nitroreducens]